MLRKIIFALVFIVVGALIGGFGAMAYTGYGLAHFMLMVQDMDIARAQEWAFDAYMNEPPETGIWVMEKYLNYFDELIESRWSVAGDKTEKKKLFGLTRPESRWIDYVRLAILYETIGDMENRDQCIQKAVEIRGVVGENIDEIMINMVRKLDAEQNEN